MKESGPPRTPSGDPLRESFYQLLGRSHAIAQGHGQGVAAYRAIARSLLALCRERWVHSTVFPFEVRLVRQFLADLGLAVPDPQALVSKSLMVNSWRAVAREPLHAMKRDDFMSVCTVEGADCLKAALAEGRGVVVVHSHTPFVRAFWAWLKHEAVAAEGLLLWQWGWEGGRKADPKDRKRTAIEGGRELVIANRTLRQGGLVHVLADGDKGERQVALPFFGRSRGFRPGFADLAVGARARIVTSDVHLGDDGSVQIRIAEGLGELPRAQAARDAAATLVRRYADHLARRWSAHPEDLPWFMMREQLLLPRA